jgi:hypothetical protein
MLLPQITCPHCWEAFPPEQTRWVAEHAELRGDVRLGPEAALRFLPSRFTPAGDALDARGIVCHALACPHCHLIFPCDLLETAPLFLSILGAAGSGKSYLLAAMTAQLRKLLPARFGTQFEDADPAANRSLIDYENSLFHNPNPDEFVPIGEFISKTALQGELYQIVVHGQQQILRAKPFLFRLGPDPNRDRSGPARPSRLVCLYDNAGEHFQPGADSISVPVTRHLAVSRALIFVYDPTRDPRFQKAMAAVRPGHRGEASAMGARQEVVFQEAAARIRRLIGQGTDTRSDRLVVVTLTKLDRWSRLLDMDLNVEPFHVRSGGRVVLDTRRIEEVSQRARQVLVHHCRELVDAVERFAQRVEYIPVSALGPRVVDVPERGPCLRPRDVQPTWAAVPMLKVLAEETPGLVPARQSGRPEG